MSFLRKLPKFHRQLYTAVTGARCWGWMISVNSMGEASWASEFPKPRMQRPAQSTADKVSEWADREWDKRGSTNCRSWSRMR